MQKITSQLPDYIKEHQILFPAIHSQKQVTECVITADILPVKEQVSVVYRADQSGAVENIHGHVASQLKAKCNVTVINGA